VRQAVHQGDGRMRDPLMASPFYGGPERQMLARTSSAGRREAPICRFRERTCEGVVVKSGDRAAKGAPPAKCPAPIAAALEVAKEPGS
jgi:hypothetical protein